MVALVAQAMAAIGQRATNIHPNPVKTSSTIAIRENGTKAKPISSQESASPVVLLPVVVTLSGWLGT
jgi:hypothetical protein